LWNFAIEAFEEKTDDVILDFFLAQDAADKVYISDDEVEHLARNFLGVEQFLENWPNLVPNFGLKF
jgi:hypothetical protein